MKILPKISYLKEPPMDQRYVIFMRRMEKIKLSFVCSIYVGSTQEGKSDKDKCMKSFLVIGKFVGRD